MKKNMGLIEKITLDIIFNGTKKTNYTIIEMLPTNINKVMKKTGLSKIPVNIHVNKLEKYGLLTRERGTGKLKSTKLARLLMRSVKEMSNYIEVEVNEMLPELIK